MADSTRWILKSNDPYGSVHGPYSSDQMHDWYMQRDFYGCLHHDIMIARGERNRSSTHDYGRFEYGEFETLWQLERRMGNALSPFQTRSLPPFHASRTAPLIFSRTQPLISSRTRPWNSWATPIESNPCRVSRPINHAQPLPANEAVKLPSRDFLMTPSEALEARLDAHAHAPAAGSSIYDDVEQQLDLDGVYSHNATSEDLSHVGQSPLRLQPHQQPEASTLSCGTNDQPPPVPNHATKPVAITRTERSSAVERKRYDTSARDVDNAIAHLQNQFGQGLMNIVDEEKASSVVSQFYRRRRRSFEFPPRSQEFDKAEETAEALHERSVFPSSNIDMLNKEEEQTRLWMDGVRTVAKNDKYGDAEAPEKQVRSSRSKNDKVVKNTDCTLHSKERQKETRVDSETAAEVISHHEVSLDFGSKVLFSASEASKMKEAASNRRNAISYRALEEETDRVRSADKYPGAPEAVNASRTYSRGAASQTRAARQFTHCEGSVKFSDSASRPRKLEDSDTSSFQDVRRTPDQQLLGEALYKKVHQLQPQLAGKITGMLMELNTAQVVGLIEDAVLLYHKVAEAYRVYEEYVKSDCSTKENLRQTLFPMIREQLGPERELANVVMGVMLEMGHAEIFDLIVDEGALRSKIDEIVDRNGLVRSGADTLEGATSLGEMESSDDDEDEEYESDGSEESSREDSESDDREDCRDEGNYCDERDAQEGQSNTSRQNADSQYLQDSIDEQDATPYSYQEPDCHENTVDAMFGMRRTKNKVENMAGSPTAAQSLQDAHISSPPVPSYQEAEWTQFQTTYSYDHNDFERNPADQEKNTDFGTEPLPSEVSACYSQLPIDQNCGLEDDHPGPVDTYNICGFSSNGGGYRGDERGRVFERSSRLSMVLPTFGGCRRDRSWSTSAQAPTTPGSVDEQWQTLAQNRSREQAQTPPREPSETQATFVKRTIEARRRQLGLNVDLASYPLTDEEEEFFTPLLGDFGKGGFEAHGVNETDIQPVAHTQPTSLQTDYHGKVGAGNGDKETTQAASPATPASLFALSPKSDHSAKEDSFPNRPISPCKPSIAQHVEEEKKSCTSATGSDSPPSRTPSNTTDPTTSAKTPRTKRPTHLHSSRINDSEDFHASVQISSGKLGMRDNGDVEHVVGDGHERTCSVDFNFKFPDPRVEGLALDVDSTAGEGCGSSDYASDAGRTDSEWEVLDEREGEGQEGVKRGWFGWAFGR